MTTETNSVKEKEVKEKQKVVEIPKENGPTFLDYSIMEPKPQAEVLEETYDDSDLDLNTLTVQQRTTLAGGFRDQLTNSKIWKQLGDQQKAMFQATLLMLRGQESINLLELSGQTTWKNEGEEKVKYYIFKFSFIVPGTKSAINFEKAWKAQHFEI